MKKIGRIIAQYPMTVFLLTLLLIFLVIFVGNQARKEVALEDETVERSRTVQVFATGEGVMTQVNGSVDRTDTVVLKATTSGVVTRALTPGTLVYRGQEVVKLSDTYGGTSVADASVALAKRNAQYQEEIFDKQYEIYEDRKDDLNKTGDIETQIMKRQISIQKRALERDRDTADLQVKQAAASAALHRTVAPLTGRLQDVTVRYGDSVSAGDTLAVLTKEGQSDVLITALMSRTRAAHIDTDAPVYALVGDARLPLEIVHIGEASTEGQAYTVTFEVASEGAAAIAEGSFVEIHLPLMANEDAVLVPLDAVHYGVDRTEVFVLSEGVARATDVTLGETVGTYVIVHEGLASEMNIILNRTIRDGEKVEVSTE